MAKRELVRGLLFRRLRQSRFGGLEQEAARGPGHGAKTDPIAVRGDVIPGPRGAVPTKRTDQDPLSLSYL